MKNQNFPLNIYEEEKTPLVKWLLEIIDSLNNYTPKRIKAHFIVCYMALALVRYVGYMLKNSSKDFFCNKLHLLLQQIRLIQMTNAQGELFEFLEKLPPEAHQIYQALNLKLHKKFAHKPGL